jgi:hypothetical protein
VSPVHFTGVELVLNVAGGHWFCDELERWSRHPHRARAAQFIPTRWDAYARVFHPARSGSVEIPWRDVASWSGRTFHPEAQWRAISTPRPKAAEASPRLGDVGAPDEGNLGRERALILADILGHHTAEPVAVWYGLWDGYGMLHAHSETRLTTRRPSRVRRFLAERRTARRRRSFRDAFEAIPKLRCEHRAYLLYRGPPAGIGAFHEPDREWRYQSPNVWWPDDRAWCVASEIDFDSTLIGGSRAAIDTVLASPHLEALEITPDIRLDANADTVNLSD